MSLKTAIATFFVAALLVTFIAWAPALADPLHLIRFAFWTGVVGFAVMAIFSRLQDVNFTTLDVLLFGFWGWSSLSLLWSKNFGEAIFTNQKYLLFAITVLAFRLGFHHWKDHRKWLPYILGVALVIALSTVSIQLLKVFRESGLEGKNVYSVFGHNGHKNLVASFLFLNLGLLGYSLRQTWRAAWWLWLLAAWSVMLMVLLRSRGVFLAVGVASLVYALHLLWNQNYLSNKGRNLMLGGLLMGLFGLGVFLTQTDLGRGYQKYFNPLTYSGSASGTERLFVWYKTSELIKDKPWLGYGTGNWKLFFPSKNISGGYRLQEKDLVFTRTHNDFLEVWAELGVPGLLIYIGSFGLALWWLWQRYRRAKSTSRGGLALLIGVLLGYCLIAFFDFPKERIEHQVYLGLLFALAAQRSPAVWSISRTKWFSAGLLLVLLVNLPISYYRYQGEAASKFIISNRHDSGKAGVLQKAADSGYSLWYDVDPMVIPLPWYSGVAHFYQQNFTEAHTQLAKAYEINPYNFNVINNLASTLVNLKQFEQAIDLYGQALLINPRFEEGMFNKAYAHFQLGQYQEALDLVNQTKDNPEKKQVFLEQIQSAM